MSKKGLNKKRVYCKGPHSSLKKNKKKVTLIITAYITVMGVHSPSNTSIIHQWNGKRANFILILIIVISII